MVFLAVPAMGAGRFTMSGIVQPMSREEADRRIEALRQEIALANSF
jgi:hypothetical protein